MWSDFQKRVWPKVQCGASTHSHTADPGRPERSRLRSRRTDDSKVPETPTRSGLDRLRNYFEHYPAGRGVRALPAARAGGTDQRILAKDQSAAGFVSVISFAEDVQCDLGPS